jgi:serine/threonine protein kinase
MLNMIQLQISYLGLTGGNSSCTELYGITELPYSIFGGTQKEGSCFCFVFERATEGHLLPYLDESVQRGDWREVANILTGVFGGLDTLHRRDIIHRYGKVRDAAMTRLNFGRDVHPGNILLTKRRLSQLGVQTGTELSVRLCDFGQSGQIQEISPGAFSNQKAASRYRAPELSARGAMHTKQTDVFAAGIFLFDVLSLAVRNVAGPNDPVLVPRRLWELCQKCTSKDPATRPQAIKAVFELERLKDFEYTAEQQEFDLIDLRNALRHLPPNDMMSSAEDINTLLSYQSINESLGRFL